MSLLFQLMKFDAANIENEISITFDMRDSIIMLLK